MPVISGELLLAKAEDLLQASMLGALAAVASQPRCK
jgi:hypothetical protein